MFRQQQTDGMLPHIAGKKVCYGHEGVDMGAFPTVGTVQSKTDKGNAQIVAGLQSRRRIRSMAKNAW